MHNFIKGQFFILNIKVVLPFTLVELRSKDSVKLLIKHYKNYLKIFASLNIATSEQDIKIALPMYFLVLIAFLGSILRIEKASA